MKTIIIDHIEVQGMFVDILSQNVQVHYVLKDSEGQQWGGTRTETYWVTIPQPAKTSDVQLPEKYLGNLVELYTAASAALKEKYA